MIPDTPLIEKSPSPTWPREILNAHAKLARQWELAAERDRRDAAKFDGHNFDGLEAHVRLMSFECELARLADLLDRVRAKRFGRLTVAGGTA